jgi:hypothetical protein
VRNKQVEQIVSMKADTLFSLLLFGLFSQGASAFEPGEGPPPSDSLSVTTSFVSVMKVANVNYPEGNLSEVLDWIRVIDIPRKYGVIIDASRMNLPETTKVKLVEKNISILQAASLVAEQIGAEILIQPGKILLVPKEKIAKEAKR